MSQLSQQRKRKCLTLTQKYEIINRVDYEKYNGKLKRVGSKSKYSKINDFIVNFISECEAEG
ncbi:hypothetical protein BB559_007148, partial [Furculomyces boomerangus]